MAPARPGRFRLGPFPGYSTTTATPPTPVLECVWPAALGAANQPFRSRTWAAAMWVVLGRDGGDFDRTRRLGAARFEQAVRREITKP